MGWLYIGPGHAQCSAHDQYNEDNNNNIIIIMIKGPYGSFIGSLRSIQVTDSSGRHGKRMAIITITALAIAIAAVTATKALDDDRSVVRPVGRP